MHHTLTKTSLSKVAIVGKAAKTLEKLLKTVEKPQSSFKAKIVIHSATSAGIMEMMFRLGHKDQKRLKK